MADEREPIPFPSYDPFRVVEFVDARRVVVDAMERLVGIAPHWELVDYDEYKRRMSGGSAT